MQSITGMGVVIRFQICIFDILNTAAMLHNNALNML